MKKILLAATSIALALSATSALSADLPSMKGPPPAYIPPPPAFSWNGLYGGINIGYGFDASDATSGANFYSGNLAGTTPGTTGLWNVQYDLNGVVGGGQVGYNWQFNPWLVIGLEADIQAADLSSQRNAVTGLATGLNNLVPHFGVVHSAQSVDWYGSIRGRIGVTPFMPNLLIYATGGFAYGQVTHNLNYADVFPTVPAIIFGNRQIDRTQTGWTAGGGVEWSPAAFPAWSLKVEYLYTDLGSTALNAPLVLSSLGPAVPFPVSIASHTVQTRFHTVKAGLNWHFNPFAPAAVLAKY